MDENTLLRTPCVPLFLSWADSPDPDGGLSLLSVPPAAVYGNRKLLHNRGKKSRIGLTLNWGWKHHWHFNQGSGETCSDLWREC